MRFVTPGEINGLVKAPASKSLMQRAIFAATMTPGQSKILNPSFCDDAVAALGIARALGAQITSTDYFVTIRGGGSPTSNEIDCNESGFCMRVAPALASLFDRRFTIQGNGSLRSRPIGPIEAPLTALGAAITTTNGCLPITLRGPIHGGTVALDASLSSQFLSGLLHALPFCVNDSVVIVNDLKSKPYILLTIELLDVFGIGIEANDTYSEFFIRGGQDFLPTTYTVEGDWSAAAFFLVAGAISGSVEVTGLTCNSAQADSAILDVLNQVGALVTLKDNGVVVARDQLKAFRFDAHDCPDLFPPLVALAANCAGTSQVSGASRLEHKESNRANALLYEFSRLGAQISVSGDIMEITGHPLIGGTVSSHDDHRIAMACAIAATRAKRRVNIRGDECVTKSYPEFFADLQSIMAT